MEPCKHCPSAHYSADTEAKDMLERGTAQYLGQSLFVCAWRQKTLCIGWTRAVCKTVVQKMEVPLKHDRPKKT